MDGVVRVMLRVVAVGIALTFLAGCLGSGSEPQTNEASEDEGVLVDVNRPTESFGDIVTGPAVGPDLNATTAAAPRLVEGEWWRVRFAGGIGGQEVDVVRVVADANEEGYIMGMPHDGWLKEAISFHSPAFGDVNFDLSYDTHNVRFEPVRFPLEVGATWDTEFALSPLTARVEAVDEYTATITFWPPEQPDQPTDPVTDLIGFTGSSGGPFMTAVYDARQHEIVSMQSFAGVWEVVEHGYDFEGWVTVPRGEHTAIDYGYFGGPVGVPGVTGDYNPAPRTVTVEGGFNRMTMMHLIVPLPDPVTGTFVPGKHSIKDTTPNGTVFLTEAMDQFTIKFYEASDPDGEWTVEDTIGGVAATYSMGIAYHQYDIRLPDGLRRTDHSHAVIR